MVGAVRRPTQGARAAAPAGHRERAASQATRDKQGQEALQGLAELGARQAAEARQEQAEHRVNNVR